MKEKLYIIDGTALIYRAFFAFIRNPLYDNKGQNVSAIFGTINSLLKLIEQFNPSNIAISFDRREKTFRHQITDTYKANRPPTPDELRQQVEPIKEFFQKIGLNDISKAGFEADDVIATLADNYQNKYEVVIVSGDKDFTQLVNEQISLFDPKSNKATDVQKVKEKYGILPTQFIDYLAICGDSADNIPGVKGIGPKGATKLLGQFGNLDEIYENIEKIVPEKLKEKLIEHKKNAYLSQKLVTIIRDVPLQVCDFKFEKNSLKNGIEFLRNFNLRSIITKIEKITAQTSISKDILEYKNEFNFEENIFDFTKTEEKNDVILVDSDAKFTNLLTEINQHKSISVDVQINDLQYDKLIGIALFCDKSYYLPFSHQMAQNLELQNILPKLEMALSRKLIIGHNFKLIYLVLREYGWENFDNIFDTMVAHYLINPNASHVLSSCVTEEFGVGIAQLSDLIGSGKKQVDFDLVPPEQAATYGGERAFYIFKIYQKYVKKIAKNNLKPLFENIEIPLIFTLAKMEHSGVFIDRKILAEISKNNQKRIGVLTKEIYELAGIQFNLNSPKQLAKVLFEDLNISPIKKTKTGYSTNYEVLEILAKDHDIAKLLIEYRQISKLESTYVSALPNLINAKTNRIHSSFNQTVTSTGRLSSSNPNLQNIPIRTSMGREIRKSFCAKNEEYVILAADYSQIELRILAMLSGDEKMLNAFQNNHDIHRETATIIYNIAKDEVSSEQRRYAKIINFGLMYGMGSFRISKELNISRKEAKEFISNYFEKFPTIKKYLNDGIEKAQKEGYVSTVFGRKLFLPEINSSNKMVAKGAERVATNMPIQGSAADIIKIAMIKLTEKFKNNDEIKMIIQVHDELVFEIKKDKLEFAEKIIIDEMEQALPVEFANIIHLKVDVGVGKNWFEAH